MFALALLIGFFLGLIFGVALAIRMATMAGYDWSTILHRWYIDLVYRVNKDEIDGQTSTDSS